MKLKLTSLLTAAALLLASTAAQAKVVVKLATIAPDGSTWHKALKEMGDKWKEASGGKVELKIYPGGTQGDEGDMVRKMRVGQLSAAAISAIGLHDITPEPQTLATPGLLQSYEELDYVMSKMGPELEKAVAAKGFQVLTWSDAGIVYIFTQAPAASPKDVANQPIFSWAGDPKAEEAWRAAGFNPKVISSVDMVPSLQTGLIKSFATSGLLALSIGWYNYAKNMTDYPWGILPGAVVVNDAIWKKIAEEDPALPAKLMEISRQVGSGLSTTLRQQGKDAIKTMKEKGLNVVEPSEAQRKEWQAAAEKAWPVIRGGTVPESTFDTAKRYVTEYRKK